MEKLRSIERRDGVALFVMRTRLYGFMKTGSSLKGIMITKNRLKTERDIVFIPHYLFLTLI